MFLYDIYNGINLYDSIIIVLYLMVSKEILKNNLIKGIGIRYFV
jgi:hypothetical protein